MNKQTVGILLSSFFATATLNAVATAEETPQKLKHSTFAGEKHCQNNSCKGNSECMGYGNDACGGGNSCKGKGWVSAENEAECTAKKGIWHGKKTDTVKKERNKKS